MKSPAVILVSPGIPQNVGAAGRLCAANGAELQIVRPIPFSLNDRALRRAGMDYLDLLTWTDFTDWDACREANSGRTLWYLSSKAERSLYDAQLACGDGLVFGSESAGLPEHVWRDAGGRALRIPMRQPAARCLNLASSVAVALYELLRQSGFQP